MSMARWRGTCEFLMVRAWRASFFISAVIVMVGGRRGVGV